MEDCWPIYGRVSAAVQSPDTWVATNYIGHNIPDDEAAAMVVDQQRSRARLVTKEGIS